MSIVRFIKQTICGLWGHDWKVEDGQDLLQSGVPWFKCCRCGKRENTL